MIRTLFTGLFAAIALVAQTPLAAGIATEAARCEAISSNTICLAYTAPMAPAEGSAANPGVFEPGAASFRITGPEGQSVIVNAAVLSPVGREWLLIRRVGETTGSNSATGQLPMDLEVFVDEAQLAQAKAGRFVATLAITLSGGSAAPLKVPVQLKVTAETDAVRAEPDTIPSLNVVASASASASRFTIGVGRKEVDPPLYVSVTPETSDGGNWLSADLRLGASQCADQSAPCSFNAVVTPPARAGEYWGVLVITGEGFADRVTVQLKVEAAPQVVPVTIEPRRVSLSVPAGSKNAVSTVVSLKGGNRDGVLYRVVYSDPWLAVDPPTGTWPVILRVSMTPLGLEPGVYTDTITLRAVATNEILATIPVRFNIIAPTLSPAVLDGGGWRTRLYLVNPSPVEARATIEFWTAASNDGAGAPWLVGVTNKGLVTRVENETIPPGGLRVIETQGAQSRTQQGWVRMTADGPVAMHTVLSEAKTVSKWLPVEATVPMLNPYRDHMLLPFDNLDGAQASVSLANADDDPVTVEVSVLNENGAEIANEGKFTLAGYEGSSVVLSQKWTSSAERRGLLSLRYDGGRLFAIGLRSQAKGFYTYPAVACAELGVDRALPNVSVGGMWQSTAYLANTTPSGQFGLLRLWPDKTRFGGQTLSDESAPVVPGNGMLKWQAPCKDTSRPAGGWLESRYSKQVNGFMLLRQSYTGTPAGPLVENYETALGGQRGLMGRVVIPFDVLGSNSTRIVLINPNEIPVDIQPVLYDLAGRYPRYQDSFRIPARGQLVVNAADRWELGSPQGMLEFSNRQGVALTGVGLRFGDGAMAVLPAYEK